MITYTYEKPIEDITDTDLDFFINIYRWWKNTFGQCACSKTWRQLC